MQAGRQALCGRFDFGAWINFLLVLAIILLLFNVISWAAGRHY